MAKPKGDNKPGSEGTATGNPRSTGLTAVSNTSSGSTALTGAVPNTSDLIASLLNPTSSVSLEDTAHNLYQSYYDQLRLAAQQAYDTSSLALQQQRANIGRNYDRQREETANQYAQAASQADRRAMQRGMGRSSYALQTTANINQAGAQAQSDLWRMQGEDESNIDQQISLGAQQLAQQLQQYASGQASDELGWIQNQMLTQDQQRNANLQYLLSYLQTANQNAISNWQWQQQFDAQNNQWQSEFNARYGNNGSSSSGGGGGNPGGNQSPAPTDDTSSGSTYSDFLNRMNFSSNQTYTPVISYTVPTIPRTTKGATTRRK